MTSDLMVANRHIRLKAACLRARLGMASRMLAHRGPSSGLPHAFFRILLLGLIATLSASAGEASSNVAIRLPIADVSDRIFVRPNVGNEPSHAWVGQIVDDSQGFLWFGSRDSMDRYDGYQLRRFNAEGYESNSATFVQECCRYTLFRDSNGKIWVGAQNSLYTYDSARERFSNVPVDSTKLQGIIRSIGQDRAGAIWIATNRGLTHFKPATGAAERFNHKAGDPTTIGTDYVRATLETADGTFWVATSASVDLLDRQTGKVTLHLSLRNPLQKPPSTGNPGVRMIEDRAGVVWVASGRDGLAYVDRRRNCLTFLSLAAGREMELGAWALIQDRDGSIWVGTEHGLLQLDAGRTRFARYRSDPADPETLPADWVLELFEDREDGLWVGTANGGVVRTSARPLPFSRYRQGHRQGGSFRTDYVLFAYEDNAGTLWEGTRGAINQIDLKTGRLIERPLGQNTEVGAIAEDKSGQIWIGTFDGSLYRFDPIGGHTVLYRQHADTRSGCGNNEVRALVVDRTGTLWAGAAESICSFDAVTDSFHAYKLTDVHPTEIDVIAEDTAGKLWVGSRQGGLYCFDPRTGKSTVFRHSDKPGSLSNDGVTSILVDRSGTIWAGTLNGLDRLDLKTGRFTVYTDHDGLPSLVINGIVEGANGDLWITTSYGLSHFQVRTKAFYNYFRSDGVFDDLTGAWKGRSGQMLFGSYSGLTVFSPAGVQEEPSTPRVVFTSFQIADKPVAVGPHSPLSKAISVSKSITLSHSQNTVSFDFAALSFADPERTRYRYRLERSESNWTDVAANQHFTRYSTLPPGDYVFRVEARTNRGQWTENGAAVRIEVLPPFWSTWLFREACAALIALSIWWMYRLRVAAVARGLDLAFQERLRERTRIAQELHDTLLQNIAGLCLQIGGLAKIVVTKPETAGERLKELRRQGEDCLREARQAVWNIRSENLDLAMALRETGNRLTAGTNCKFVLREEGEPRRLSLDLREQLLRIGQEALANAVRHAAARSIDALLHFQKRRLQLRISDDGHGFDMEKASALTGHFGLITMRERATTIGGSILISSKINSGTSIEVAVNL
jgi:signal transduction histidine kinase/ligand-binding sensor domain-containing protein